ncbi:hypothetical protein C7M84_014673 [Penaeus vannamei]|uniref:Uncharacterized protein n=1 Tax=Penaeus vannamei TaxID=6689 RepID=A0A3R7NUR5_PENVA|nr:hypothetical protein C7M84_014673 [Penaeus vannamei]
MSTTRSPRPQTLTSSMSAPTPSQRNRGHATTPPQAILGKESLVIKPQGKVQTVFKGESFFVSCSSDADNVQRVMWTGPEGQQITDYRGSVPYNEIPRVHVEDGRSGHKGVDLIFTNISRTDRGKYTCSANVDGVEEERSFDLVVLKHLDFMDTPVTQFLEEDHDSVLRCDVDGDPAPRVSWNINNRKVTFEKLFNHQPSLPHPFPTPLSITALPPPNAPHPSPPHAPLPPPLSSPYAPLPPTPLTPSRPSPSPRPSPPTRPSPLHALPPKHPSPLPHALSPPSRPYALSHALLLILLPHPHPTLSPHFPSHAPPLHPLSLPSPPYTPPRTPLLIAGKKYDKGTEHPNDLIVRNATLEDAGQYKCVALQLSNYTSEVKDLVIEVKVHPYGYVTGDVNLTCEAVAEPHANFTWIKDDQVIEPNETVQIINEDHKSVLRLKVTDVDMFGDYVCKAENKLGTLERVIILEEGKKPAVPSAKVTETEVNAIHLKLDANNHPDMPILAFRVQYKTAGDNWINAQSMEFKKGDPYVINSLAGDTLYVLRASAKNAAGYSDFSSDFMERTKKIHESQSQISAANSLSATAQVFVPLVVLLASLL